MNATTNANMNATMNAHMMTWKCPAFSSIDNTTLYHILALRAEVFVVEQQCAYQDNDGKDMHPEARHLYCCGDNLEHVMQNPILAYARILPPGVSYAGCSIGRVVVAPSKRGQGVAKALMLEAMQRCQALWPQSPIEIGAQVYLMDFYQALGFVAFSDEYLEDGIPHIDMRYVPAQ